MTATADASHAGHFADRASFATVEVAENRRIARDTYRLRFLAPQIAERIVPGQFIMLRLAGSNDPLLGRPLALYDTVVDEAGRAIGVDVVYLVVGKLTRKLAALSPGQPLEVWGPLGNGFPPQSADHLLMVAGGIGQTPFLALAQEYLGRRRYGSPPRNVPRANRVTLCYGARNREYLAGVED
ncbi:MAG TPA: FAD-binding oxidoreductase, partial [Pirellulales bacterium]|nr:FAD-binding oxidoreductase [Pirellulales bacterium]